MKAKYMKKELKCSRPSEHFFCQPVPADISLVSFVSFLNFWPSETVFIIGSYKKRVVAKIAPLPEGKLKECGSPKYRWDAVFCWNKKLSPHYPPTFFEIYERAFLLK